MLGLAGRAGETSGKGKTVGDVGGDVGHGSEGSREVTLWSPLSKCGGGSNADIAGSGKRDEAELGPIRGGRGGGGGGAAAAGVRAERLVGDGERDGGAVAEEGGRPLRPWSPCQFLV